MRVAAITAKAAMKTIPAPTPIQLQRPTSWAQAGTANALAPTWGPVSSAARRGVSRASPVSRAFTCVPLSRPLSATPSRRGRVAVRRADCLCPHAALW